MPEPTADDLYIDLEQHLKRMCEKVRRNEDAEEALSLMRRSFSAYLRAKGKRDPNT